MKRLVLVTILAAAVMVLSPSAGDAGVWDAHYLNVPGYAGDYSRVTDRFSWGSPFYGVGYTHLAVTWNETVVTASGIEMNPDGRPLVYYWADVYSSFYDLYYSFDGFYWYYYGHYVY